MLGDFRYFYLENSLEELPENYPDQRQEMEEHYATQHASLAEARARFAEHGVFYSENRIRLNSKVKDYDFRNDEPANILNRLGGGDGAGNWADGFPLDTSDNENVRPLAPDGTPFYFVTAVTGWNYCDFAADSILLFFEPNSRTALLTFDWS